MKTPILVGDRGEFQLLEDAKVVVATIRDYRPLTDFVNGRYDRTGGPPETVKQNLQQIRGTLLKHSDYRLITRPLNFGLLTQAIKFATGVVAAMGPNITVAASVRNDENGPPGSAPGGSRDRVWEFLPEILVPVLLK